MDFGSNFDVFDEKASVADADRVQTFKTDVVYPDPDNVRRAIDPEKIDSMAQTIAERGQLQAIIVAPRDDDGRYRILFGERRWRACCKLGIDVKAIVSKNVDPDQVQIDQFIENDQREDLSTADMIAFVVKQAEKRPLAQVAKLTGRDLTQLKRLRSLADAPDFIAALLPHVSMRSALELTQAAKKDEAATRAFVSESDTEDLTVKACEQFSRGIGAKGSKLPPEPVAPAIEDARQEPLAPIEEGRGDVETPTPSPSPSPEPASRPKPSASSPDTLTNKAELRAEGPRPSIEIDGKHALLVEALLQFEDEDEPRVVTWR